MPWQIPSGCSLRLGRFPDRKFLFSLPIEEGIFPRSAVVFRGRIDLPDTPAPSLPRIAASGNLSPSVYARWDGVQPELPAHVERRGERGGGEKSGPRSFSCGPEVLGNGSEEKSSTRGGDRPGSFLGSKPLREAGTGKGGCRAQEKFCILYTNARGAGGAGSFRCPLPCRPTRPGHAFRTMSPEIRIPETEEARKMSRKAAIEWEETP